MGARLFLSNKDKEVVEIDWKGKQYALLAWISVKLAAKLKVKVNKETKEHAV